MTAAGFQDGATRRRLRKRLGTKSCLGLWQSTWVSVATRRLGPDQPGRLSRTPAPGPVRAEARAAPSSRDSGRRTCPHSAVTPRPGAGPRLHFPGGSEGWRAQGSPAACSTEADGSSPISPASARPCTIKHLLSEGDTSSPGLLGNVDPGPPENATKDSAERVLDCVRAEYWTGVGELEDWGVQRRGGLVRLG